MIILLIIIVSFIGLYFLIHICSKSGYIFEYSSSKRKIKIHPSKDVSFHTTGKDKA